MKRDGIPNISRVFTGRYNNDAERVAAKKKSWGQKSGQTRLSERAAREKPFLSLTQPKAS